MLKYTLRRFVEMLFTLFLIATATFFMLEAIPGNPLSERADRMPKQAREALYAKYGLDRPVMERYVKQMTNMMKGDFGESIVYAGQTVGKLIHEASRISKTWITANASWRYSWAFARYFGGNEAGHGGGLSGCRSDGLFDLGSASGIRTSFAKDICRNTRVVSDHRVAGRKGFMDRRMEVYSSSDVNRLLWLYCGLCQINQNIDAGCC